MTRRGVWLLFLLELPVVLSSDIGCVHLKGLKRGEQFDELKELVFIQSPPAA